MRRFKDRAIVPMRRDLGHIKNNFYNIVEDLLKDFYQGIPTIFGNDFSVIGTVDYPKLDVIDKKDRTIIKASVPGVEKKNLTITIKDGILDISGKATQECKDENYACHEIKSSAFRRRIAGFNNDTFILDPEKIITKLENGILTLEILKKEVQKSDTEEIKIDLE